MTRGDLETTPLVPTIQDGTDEDTKKAGGKHNWTPVFLVYVGFLLLGLVVSGTANGVLYKVVITKFGQEYSFFVDQGNNFNYWLFSGVGAFWRATSCWGRTPQVTQEMRRFPHSKFLFLGLLDGLGTFLACIGGVYTPGDFQTIANQLLIPITMMVTIPLLKVRYTNWEVAGALVILAGAMVTMVPSFAGHHSAATFRWYSTLIYVCSNIPMAFSAVYKEIAFDDCDLDVYYLTFWVSFYQMALSFVLAPVQALHGFGGIALGDIPGAFWNGMRCFGGAPSSSEDHCTWPGHMLFLVGYSLVNFTFNIFGLYLTKDGSAVLSSIGYALKLPVTNLVFSLCAIMGPFCEPFTWETILGLLLTSVGFVLYSWATRRAQLSRRRAESERARIPDSFQERVVGMGKAHHSSAPV